VDEQEFADELDPRSIDQHASGQEAEINQSALSFEVGRCYNEQRALAALFDRLSRGHLMPTVIVAVAILIAVEALCLLVVQGAAGRIGGVSALILFVLALLVQPAGYIIGALKIEGRRVPRKSFYRARFGEHGFEVRTPTAIRLRIPYRSLTDLRTRGAFFLFEDVSRGRTVILPVELLPAGGVEWLEGKVRPTTNPIS
jgi:hypothetical protein